jgi:hypothetical protein
MIDKELSTSFAAWHDSVGSRDQSAANKDAASDFWRRRQLTTAFATFGEHASKIIRLRRVIMPSLHVFVIIRPQCCGL